MSASSASTMHSADCRCKLCRTLAPKPYHLARLIGPKGEISPWCAKTPRKLNLKTELWTIRMDAVTCAKCRDAYQGAEKLNGTND